MKCFRWFCLILMMSVAAVSFAGDIQVVCEPGLRVFLDGHFVGSSSAREDGIFLSNVREGAHIIRLEKDGFLPQSFKVEVAKIPTQVKAEEFTPEPLIRPDGETGSPEVNQPTGSLIVTSVPQNCVVEIDGKSQTKDAPLLRIDGLAAGEHRATFTKPGYDRITGMVRVQPGAEVMIRGDLKAGKVETIYQGKGSLRLTSFPVRCTIRFLGKIMDKTHSVLNVSHIPAGEHKIVAMWKGQELSSTILITDGHRAMVTVNFIKNQAPVVVSYEPL